MTTLSPGYVWCVALVVDINGLNYVVLVARDQTSRGMVSMVTIQTEQIDLSKQFFSNLVCLFSFRFAW